MALLVEVKAGLSAIYGERLRGRYLYGSFARGEQDAESDVDVLVVLNDVPLDYRDSCVCIPERQWNEVGVPVSS